MKIVYLYPCLRTIGGADRVISEKANYLAEKGGFEVYFITTSQLGHPLTFPLSQKVTHIDFGIDFDKQYTCGFLKRGFIYFNLMYKYKKVLSKLLFQLHPDIVISALGRESDFLTKIKDGSKKIAEIHIAKDYIRNFHLMRQRKGLYPIIAKIWTRKMEKSARQYDAVVVLTERDAKTWSKIRSVEVIPNSLPFYPQVISKCTSNKIISVGRLSEQKGYDMLIPAWKIVTQQYPQWHLHIYGQGELQQELEVQIRDCQIEETFHIETPVTNIIDKYNESAFYIMSSRFEGFGMVLIEAMACGLPCISFDCPFGPSDIIQDTKDGLLVENGNIEQLAEKIKYMISHTNERQQMGLAARENVLRYSQKSIMQKWISLFEKIKQA